MISDPAFLSVHRSRAQPLLVAVSNYGCCGSASTSVQIMDTDGYIARRVDLDGLWMFRASVDGLVLLASRAQDNIPAMRVINLASRQTIVKLPRPDKAGYHVWLGFGRASRSGTLKVIRIVDGFFSFFGDHGTCEVLTVGDPEWRQTRSPQARLYDSNDCRDGVTVNGVLHFLSKTWGDIHCFDLEREDWTTIHGPLGIRTPMRKIGLAELNGSLCITLTEQYTVHMWFLTDHSNKDVWVKAYTISVNRDVPLVPLSLIGPSGKLLFYYRRDKLYGFVEVLHVYEPCTGKCTAVKMAPMDIVGRIGLLELALAW